MALETAGTDISGGIGVGKGLKIGNVIGAAVVLEAVFPADPFLAVSICLHTSPPKGAAKSPDPPSLQKMQPRLPQVPSRLGQVMPPSKESL